VPVIRHPISFSLTPPRHELPPPALGQDNEQIRAWLSQPSSATRRDARQPEQPRDHADEQ
jgi:crotonobetainyl-CoA:carnitine CoA-transferase CaiB-like acyl-CoA transferase